MDKTFTFVGDLSTALDYARARLNDIDPLIVTDESGTPSPFLWDATYLALFDRFGTQEGMAMAALMIGLKIGRFITSFGEQGGMRFSKRLLSFYADGGAKLAEQIRSEESFDDEDGVAISVIGSIKAGNADTYWPYRRYEQYPPPPVPDVVCE